MKKLFTTNENIADRAFVQSIAVSVVGILLCIVALCSATYAWFVADISSQNTISAAYFDLDVTVYDITQLMTTQTVAEGENGTEGEPATTADPIQLVADHGVYTMQAGHTYKVTISVAAKATASKGYCDMVVYANSNTTTYRSLDVTKDSNGSSTSIVFQMKVTGTGTANVVFQPKWGAPGNGEGIQPITETLQIEEGLAPTETKTEGSEGTETTNPTQPATVPETTVPETTEPATEPTEPATEPTEPATEPTEPESNNE